MMGEKLDYVFSHLDAIHGMTKTPADGQYRDYAVSCGKKSENMQYKLPK